MLKTPPTSYTVESTSGLLCIYTYSVSGTVRACISTGSKQLRKVSIFSHFTHVEAETVKITGRVSGRGMV